MERLAADYASAVAGETEMDELVRLRAELTQLREVAGELAKAVRHDGLCDSVFYYPRRLCNCGYESALAAFDKLKDGAK